MLQACLWTPAELSGWLEKKGKQNQHKLHAPLRLKPIWHAGTGYNKWNKRFFILKVNDKMMACVQHMCSYGQSTQFIYPAYRLILAWQGNGLFYFSDIKASSAKGVIPIELAKVEASRDKKEKKRYLIKVWVAAAYADIAKHKRYILSSPSSQVQVRACNIISRSASASKQYCICTLQLQGAEIATHRSATDLWTTPDAACLPAILCCMCGALAECVPQAKTDSIMSMPAVLMMVFYKNLKRQVTSLHHP